MKSQRRTRLALTLAAIGAVVALVTACQPTAVVGKASLRQPANIPRVWDNSDPAVLTAGAKTYLYGSTNNKKVPVRQITYFTGNLEESRIHWGRYPRDAMPTKPAWVNGTRHGGTWQIWAPSVTQIGNRYVMYFSSNRSGARDLHNDQCIGMATSSSPAGPFAPGSSPIYCGLKSEPGSNTWGRGALDPEVFKAPTGRLFLLVSLSRTKGNVGVIPLTNTGTNPGGINAAPKILVSQSQSFRNGVFLENPTMHHDPATNTYLLFYSAGDWRTGSYATGFARCDTPQGPCAVDKRGAFLQSGSGRSGPGGMTVFTDPGGTLRVAYASWQAGHESPRTNPGGKYSRQTHFANLIISKDSVQQNQTIRLG
ncbi:MAG: family 43 glycosylhydrolase [Aquihabitans sp.]